LTTFTIAGVRAEDLPRHLRAIEPMLASIAERGRGIYSVSDLCRAIANEEFQLWIVTRLRVGERAIVAAGLTELVNHPGMRVCRLIAWTGEGHEDWLHLLDDIEAWARQAGARRMIPIARPGWKKALKQRGYSETHVVLEKDL
jgi:hypothetical protein